MMKKWSAGSMSPDLVPITRPSRGVRPIEVSMLTPPCTAAQLAPLPKMEGDEVQCLRRFAQIPRRLSRDVEVGGAVKAVPPT